MTVFKFMSIELFPVCTPEMMRGSAGLRRPKELRSHPLLRHSRRNYWPAWLDLVGLSDLAVTYGPEFDDASLAMDGVLHGQGACISNHALAGDLIAARRLVRPFRRGLPSDNSYYLLCRDSMADNPRVAALREWLVRTVERDSGGHANLQSPTRWPRKLCSPGSAQSAWRFASTGWYAACERVVK